MGRTARADLPTLGQPSSAQIVLAQVGTALAVVTAVFIAVISVGSRFPPLYSYSSRTTTAWAINSLNYWVSDIPVYTWAWDRLVNAALDQFAVFLALFFHRLVRVRRPGVERALWTFAADRARERGADAAQHVRRHDGGRHHHHHGDQHV